MQYSDDPSVGNSTDQLTGKFETAGKLTGIVFLGGGVLRVDLSLQLAIILVGRQPAAVREIPFPTEMRAVNLNVIEEPRAAATFVVVSNTEMGKRKTAKLWTTNVGACLPTVVADSL